MTTTTLTLADFLLARIAEDEAEIGIDLFGHDDSAGPNGLGWAEVGAISEVLMSSHRRALAEVAAKRAIVEAYIDEGQRMEIYNRGYDNGELTTQSDLKSRLSSNARWAGLDLAARYMLQVYADHPDFNPRWLRESW